MRLLTRATLMYALAAAFLTFIAFWPALSHEFVDWDDRDNFLNNPDYRGLGWDNIEWMFMTFRMGHYQPLTWLSLAVNAVIGEVAFGDALDPRPYHFTNNLLHAINAGLVFFIALRLIGYAWRLQSWTRPAMVGAFAAALFFGVHPLRVESVAWATERRDLLSGFFLFLTVLAYFRAADERGSRHWRWIIIALALFTASLMSKVIGVTLSAVLLILDWYPLRRLGDSPREWFSPARRGVWLEKIPFFALTFIFSFIATRGQGRHDWLVTLELHPIPARILQSLYGLTFYVWKTIAPFDLLPLYQTHFPMDTSHPRFAIAAAIVFIALALLVWLFMTRRWPALVAAAAVYFVMLSPVLGMIQNGMQIVADRYSYLPCIGLAVVGGGLAGLAIQQSRAWVGIVAAVIITALGALTWKQTLVWRDTASLWTYTAAKDPNSSHAQNGYGFVLLQDQRYDDAIAHLRRAIELLPANDMAHYNLWNALEAKGDQMALAAAFNDGKRIPSVAAGAHYRHGVMLMNQEQHAAAEHEFRASLERQPNRAPARVNLGYVVLAQGRSAEAIEHYRVAAQLDPKLFQARYNLGIELHKAGFRQQAIEHLRAAVLLNPNHANARAVLRELEQSN